MEKRWYVIQIIHDIDGVVSKLEEDLKDLFYCPKVQRKELDTQKNKVKTTTYPMFIDYAFIAAENFDFVRGWLYNKDYKHKIQSLSSSDGSVSFVSYEDIQKYRKQEAKCVRNSKAVLFCIGDEVKVIDGSFRGFTGIVQSFDKEKVSIVARILGKASIFTIPILSIELI